MLATATPVSAAQTVRTDGCCGYASYCGGCGYGGYSGYAGHAGYASYCGGCGYGAAQYYTAPGYFAPAQHYAPGQTQPPVAGFLPFAEEFESVTTLSAYPNPAEEGETVTLHASVRCLDVDGFPDGVPVDGEVTFEENGTELTSGQVEAGGIAEGYVSDLQPGTHGITATFGGGFTADGDYCGPSPASAIENVVVTAAPTPTPTPTPTPPTVNVHVKVVVKPHVRIAIFLGRHHHHYYHPMAPSMMPSKQAVPVTG